MLTFEQSITLMRKYRLSQVHVEPRTMTRPYLHSSRPSITSRSKKRASNNANLRRLQEPKVQPKRRGDQSLVARKAYVRRCVWHRNKQQRARSNTLSFTVTRDTCEYEALFFHNIPNWSLHSIPMRTLQYTHGWNEHILHFYTPAISYTTYYRHKRSFRCLANK